MKTYILAAGKGGRFSQGLGNLSEIFVGRPFPKSLLTFHEIARSPWEYIFSANPEENMDLISNTVLAAHLPLLSKLGASEVTIIIGQNAENKILFETAAKTLSLLSGLPIKIHEVTNTDISKVVNTEDQTQLMEYYSKELNIPSTDPILFVLADQLVTSAQLNNETGGLADILDQKTSQYPCTIRFIDSLNENIDGGLWGVILPQGPKSLKLMYDRNTLILSDIKGYNINTLEECINLFKSLPNGAFDWLNMHQQDVLESALKDPETFLSNIFEPK